MIISIIRSDFREFTTWLHNYLVYRRHSFKMRLAIRLADMKQRAYNKQYHVMIFAEGAADKLVSVNNEDINRLKRKKWLPKDMGMIELQRSSIFYSTPLSRNNKSSAEDRKNGREKYMKYAKKFLR